MAPAPGGGAANGGGGGGGDSTTTMSVTSANGGNNNAQNGGNGGGDDKSINSGRDNLQHKTDGSIALCASCDRCRARKTKCDGKRPCSNCATKYMKKNKLTSIEGIDLAEFECVYSPAKRRGPVPGRSHGQTRKASDAFGNGSKAGGSSATRTNAASNGTGGAAPMDIENQQPNPMAVPSSSNAAIIQQQLALLQKLQQQHQRRQARGSFSANGAEGEERSAQRTRTNPEDDDDDDDDNMSDKENRCIGSTGTFTTVPVPKTVSSHSHLLERNDAEGNRLRAYYRLSIDELYRLPLVPTNEEYCTRYNRANPGTLMTITTLPNIHLAALSASRFAEVALGAIVHQETSLAMELCNAVVHCLRECVSEPVQDAYLYEVSRAYFLLGVFRAFRGDMERYFKYRRVAMTYASKLPDDEDSQSLMAAVSFLDAWAYMIYNAEEETLPAVDGTVPPVPTGGCGDGTCSKIACDPDNKNWIQGAPPVYLNNEAPLPSRALDALACAVRSCCDQANTRFLAIHHAAELGDERLNSGHNAAVASNVKATPTATAVTASQNELCSRNLVLSAFTLMQQYEGLTGSSPNKNQGIRMIISAMDAFLENSEEEGMEGGGFTDSQIQSLLSVCNTAVENPFLLYHAGPTYHTVTNAAVLLCHLLNGMYAQLRSGARLATMEMAMFEETMDTVIAVRKLLTIHRRKLPVKLRCHGIPRPSLNALVMASLLSSGRGGGGDGGGSSAGSDSEDSEFPNIQCNKPLIDLGETILCSCRGCQGFVLMACSPCVAAERAVSAQNRLEVDEGREVEAVENSDLDRELDDLGAEFNLDDDALLGMISQLITN